MKIVDIFMWNTIGQVLPQATQKEKEDIYSKLFGKVWRIDDIERLYEERK